MVKNIVKLNRSAVKVLVVYMILKGQITTLEYLANDNDEVFDTTYFKVLVVESTILICGYWLFLA